MKKLIPLFLITLPLSACGGHSGKSFSESVKTTGKVIALSPVLIPVGSVIGGKKVAQKSAVATKAPPKWFSEEVSGEELKNLMDPRTKLAGKCHYMGSKEKHHYFSHDVIGRKIYRVLQTEYSVEDPFTLTSVKSKWRAVETLRGEPFDDDLEELLDRFRADRAEDDR